jgi:subtilisin family serine protease
MRQSAIVVAALALSAFAVSADAQFAADSQVHAERADGTEVVMPSFAEPGNGYIVEFVAPPAAKVAAKSAFDSHATLTRFRNDLGTIVNAKRSGKTALQAEIRREFSIVFSGAAIDASRETVDQIRSLPYVKRVVADVTMHAFADPLNVTVINAPKVWTSLGSRGAGVTVAIIDTGIDYTHPALGSGIGPGFKIKGGWDFVNNDSDPFDDNGHGTHVAGIIAGQSDQITGVAPDVSLISYKVLGANGSGSESNVIAAIERAADPNQDGNTADHVDVANLSLGGAGNPDDPGSIAIDNASIAGVTFAIAAGNSGGFHTIGSPGTSRSAITVGASDLGDAITSFSSRGPNMKNMAIKPDVIAPGALILSSYPGNRYMTLSGTSMASPHVAGAAALLKALHHDWTPAQVKLALMNNATLLHDEIMAGGAGRIDAFAAATGTLRIDPPSVSLGLAPIELPSWTAARSLHVTNTGTQSVTYNIKSNVVIGEKVTPSSNSVTIPAGGSTDVNFTFAIDNTQIIASSVSLAGGGQIVFTNAASASDIHNIQFGFSKAARATVTFDRAYPDTRWVSDSRQNIISAARLDDNTSEVLMLPGTWDMVIYTPEFDEINGGIIGADFVSRDALSVTKDTTIALTTADVPHTIQFRGRRENGQTLTGAGYASTIRVLLGGATGGFTSMTYPWANVHEVHASDISSAKSLLVYETLLDTVANNYYMIQHPPFAGVSADVTLNTGGSALRGGAVQLAIPAASLGDRRLAVNAASLSGAVVTSMSIVDAPIINARVFVSPDVTPSFTYGISFGVISDAATQYATPLLRVVNDKLVGLTSAGLLPWTYSGSTYEYGLGPRFPASTFTPAGTTRATVTTDIFGPLGEIRVADRAGTTTTLYDSHNAKVIDAAPYLISVDWPSRAPYRLESINQGTLYPGVKKTTTVTMNLDMSRPDFIPPSLTTMMMLDGTGAIATRLDSHGSGSLLFSAADFTANGLSSTRFYQPVRGDATAVSYRYSGETAWRSLTPTQVSEDAAIGSGILYRVDLASVANAVGLVDLKFDLADTAGNTTTVTMAPAFSVGPELAPRHRASH